MDTDSISDAPSAITLAVWLVVQLLNAQDSMILPPAYVHKSDSVDPFEEIFEILRQPVEDPLASMNLALHAFCSSTPLFVLDDDLGFWVKPRSTTWFSRFLMEEYDNTRRLEMFRMPKWSIFALADVLGLRISQKDTRYCVAIPVLVRVACTLFKLTHGVPLLVCSEMFAVGKSTVSGVFRDVVHAINVLLRHHVSWPTGDRMQVTQEKFSALCGLPSVVGAIDGTHISIAKPRHVPSNYYYFKSGGYTLNCQAVIDSDKRFLDLYLGMQGSTNDSRVLRRSSLFDLATHTGFFTDQASVDGVSPYLLGDQGYPLLPWLMVPHRHNVPLSLAESLFNSRLCKGRCVVENAFGILKQTFRELLIKSNLDVVFLPDVILSCAILHNILLSQPEEDVEHLLGVLRTEGLVDEVVEDMGGDVDAGHAHEARQRIPETAAIRAAVEKIRLLGLRLSAQRPPLP